MVPVVIEPITSMPAADNGPVRAEDVVVRKERARINSQNFAEGSSYVTGYTGFFIRTVTLVIVLVAVGGTALRYAERQVSPVVGSSGNTVARADSSHIIVSIISDSGFHPFLFIFFITLLY